MITVLVKYQTRVEAPHPMLDDCFLKHTVVVEVLNLTDVNAMFPNIIDVKILERE